VRRTGFRFLILGVCTWRLVSASAAPVAAQAAPTADSFKVAYWNVQSGNGERPLAGRACGFTENGNCTDASLPLNAWGMHVVQDALVQDIQQDPAMIALGLSEAWNCGTAAAIQQVLGWAAKSTTRNGIALVAKYGFAGPEQWAQLDTSGNTNPADTMWMLRVPVCLDGSCQRSLLMYATHMYAAAATDAGDYTVARTQAQQALAFTAAVDAPHVVVGDFNVFEGTSVICGQNPRNEGLKLFRAAGYLDAWLATNGTEDGSTGMWNRATCGVPEGSLWKRIDYGWSRSLVPISMKRFGMVQPGECAPSDHAGIIVEYALPDSVPAPAVTVEAPAPSATVAGQVRLTAGTAADAGIARVEFILDGRHLGVVRSSPFALDWDSRAVANGPYSLQVAATDVSGRRGVSLTQPLIVHNPSGPDDEVVLYARDAVIAGTSWSAVPDATAAAGVLVRNAQAGAATLSKALANPSHYVELSFTANANTGYRLWMRGSAAADSADNDSVHVQFSDSVDAAGIPTFRIGTQSSSTVNIEDCQACGLAGWGWQDNGYARDVLGPLVYFATTGTHTVRMQSREDGLSVDQVLLSAVAYRHSAPGALTLDATIVPVPGARVNLPPAVTLTAPSTSAAYSAPASIAFSAEAVDSDGTVARVEFLAGTTVIGSSAAAPFEFSWTGVPAGEYLLSARAVDSDGGVTQSALRTITVSPVVGPPVVEPPVNLPPAVVLTAPANVNFIAPASVGVAATATDPDDGVARVDFLLGGTLAGSSPAAPYGITLTGMAAGDYILTAVATDVAGHSTASAPVIVSVSAVVPQALQPIDEIVLHAAAAAQVIGGWTITADATAAGGARLQNPNLNAAKPAAALSTPLLAFELSFNADAGKAYRLWLRGKALSDSYNNDSVFVQFDGSVDAGMHPVWRSGTASATTVILEDCSGCGVKGWGWADNAYGLNALGPVVYFANAGVQRIRIQMREDGIGIDQVVLSAVRYKTMAPGAAKNDATILAAGDTGTATPVSVNTPPQVALTSPATGMRAAAPASLALVASASDADGAVASVQFFAGTTLVATVASAPYAATWNNVPAGVYSLTARATDDKGASTTTVAMTVTVEAAVPVAPGTAIDEVVLHAAAQAQVRSGWAVIADAAAAGGVRLQNANVGAAKVAIALASPPLSFDLTFEADAGRPYRLWLRGKAIGDSYNNDSVYVQFDGSVDAAGKPLWRLDTADGTIAILEDCNGCGLKGWGWTDNGYGANVLGPVIYFARSGPQRLRIQAREDGLAIDQVVLSAVRYLSTSPGTPKNDTIILPR
jgi:hypothetical protein